MAALGGSWLSLASSVKQCGASSAEQKRGALSID
jgi:hypothetical protein